MLRKSKNKFSILSLFSGAGGLDRGFENSGRFVTQACIEYEPIFAKTLEGNQVRGFMPDAAILNDSIRDLQPNRVKAAQFSGTSPVGIIGGPPCETFSVIGNRKGMDDLRGNLVYDFLRWVDALKPRFFLMENVPRLKTLDNGKAFNLIIKTAEKSGYTVSHSILKASDYGAPTVRKRLFIIAVIGKSAFKFPSPTHSGVPGAFGLLPCITSSQALTGLPEPGYSNPGNPQGHIKVRHITAVAERFAMLLPGQRDNIRKRNRLHPDKPSPTLVAGNLMQIRSHIHPTEPRELTNRESARLHGFPDNFIFAGNHAAMGKQIANSVPIPLAEALARELAKHLDQELKQ